MPREKFFFKWQQDVNGLLPSGLKIQKVWWNIAILSNLLFVDAQQEQEHQHERKQ